MTTRELRGLPSLPSLYVRAAVSMVPGASLLPGLGGKGREVPDLELVVADLVVDAGHLAAYERVCGFAPGNVLPPTYPQVVAFPVQLALMTDGSFPFGPVGLVHIENRITQRRPIGLGDALTLRVHATELEPHPRGKKFSIVTEARVGGELVWESHGTELRRESGFGADAGAEDGGAASAEAGRASRQKAGAGELPMSAEWRISGDIGRRYAAVSGDRNPIHLYGICAKPFGFPRPIAHGMWTKARCLAALQGRLPDAYTVEVRFRRPLLLPSTVAFASEESGERIRFAVRDAADGTPHLDGTLVAA
jgi:acyl dehydratase